MRTLPRPLVLPLALAALVGGCDRAPNPAAQGDACRYGSDSSEPGCAAGLYCHPTRDADGALAREAEGVDKTAAVGTCQAKVAAKAACTKDSVCVDGHTCQYADPAIDQGVCTSTETSL